MAARQETLQRGTLRCCSCMCAMLQLYTSGLCSMCHRDESVVVQVAQLVSWLMAADAVNRPTAREVWDHNLMILRM
jgi:hypothetical protein